MNVIEASIHVVQVTPRGGRNIRCDPGCCGGMNESATNQVGDYRKLTITSLRESQSYDANQSCSYAKHACMLV